MTLTLDLYDGQGNPVIAGNALFTPTAQLTDTTNHELITQAAVPCVFHSGGLPAVKLLATDNGPPAPPGWAWTVTFAGVPGSPASFSFFLPFSNGATQKLSSLTPVAAPTVMPGASWIGVSPSGDATGALDTAAFAAIKAQASASNPLVMVLRATGTGTPYYATSLPQITPWFSIWCPSFSAVIMDVGAGSGTSTPASFLIARDSSFQVGGSSAAAGHVLGSFGGFILDGSSHTSTGRAGIEMGDAYGVDAADIIVQNYGAANDIGWWLINQIGWLEKGRTRNCFAYKCTNAVVFDVGAGYSSHDYSHWEFNVAASANQNGVTWQNGATQIGGSFTLIGNFYTGVTNSGTVLLIGADSSSVSLYGMRFSVFVECDNSSGTAGPAMYNVGSSAFVKAAGDICFLQSDSSHVFQAGNLSPGQNHLQVAGWIGYVNNGGAGTSPDAVIPVNNGEALTSMSAISGAQGLASASGGNLTVFSYGGDYFKATLANGSNVLKLSGFTPGRARTLSLVLTQPASGAPGTISYASPGTNTAGTSIVIAYPGQGNIAPALNRASSAIDVLHLWTLDGVTFYAERPGNLLVPYGLPGSIFLAGQWYPQIASTGTALQVTASTAYAIPFPVGTTHTFAGIGSYITSGGSGGTPQLRFGIYADNGAGYPGALVTDGGATSATGTGSVSTAPTPTLTPGLYWLVVAAQGASTQPTLQTIQAGPAAAPFAIFGAAAAGAGSTVCGYYVAGVAGALPSTFPGSATMLNQAPVVTVQA